MGQWGREELDRPYRVTGQVGTTTDWVGLAAGAIHMAAAAGESHTLALQDAGRMWSWGDNN